MMRRLSSHMQKGEVLSAIGMVNRTNSLNYDRDSSWPPTVPRLRKFDVSSLLMICEAGFSNCSKQTINKNYLKGAAL